MNVYTHYKTLAKQNVGYRWRTLLQFGTSWDIIGSVVMMNPGSANFKRGAEGGIMDEAILSHLRQLDYADDHDEKWYEFNADQTMGCVAELFAQYMGKTGTKDLQGVIQIFNLFYLREPNLGTALRMNQDVSLLKQINDKIFEHDLLALKQPVYLGFGWLSQTSEFREKAMRYFKEATEKHNAKYLNPDFDKNPFTHPRRLMRFIKNRPEGIAQRARFCTNSADANTEQ